MTHFRVNTPNVIHETIDGEAVVVNLHTGSYYSIDKVGAAVWSHLENGHDLPAIVARIAAEYRGDAADIDAGVRDMIAQLEAEGLVVPAEGTPSNGSVPVAASADRPPFERPVLHKYTDMEALLLLDPIHDVGDKGWPNAPDKK